MKSKCKECEMKEEQVEKENTNCILVQSDGK
jgi:hypothetical protein